jgi:hypothetical protein
LGIALKIESTTVLASLSVKPVFDATFTTSSVLLRCHLLRVLTGTLVTPRKTCQQVFGLRTQDFLLVNIRGALRKSLPQDRGSPVRRKSQGET